MDIKSAEDWVFEIAHASGLYLKHQSLAGKALRDGIVFDPDLGGIDLFLRSTDSVRADDVVLRGPNTLS